MPSKTVKRHESEKPWISDEFKRIIQDRQKAFQPGSKPLYNQLRDKAIREGKKIKINIPSTQIGTTKV